MGALVAAGHEATVAAATRVLAAGGNAFDAAIAAGAAAAVAEPGLTSAAGGGFLLAVPTGADPILFDFFMDTPGRGLTDPNVARWLDEVTISFPGAQQLFWVGPASIAVPGCLPGWVHVHERLGRIPLADVLAPAIDLALHGVEVSEFQAALFSLLAPIFGHTSEVRSTYFVDDRPPAPGGIIANPALGRFLGAVADGLRLDDATLAAQLTDEVQAQHGALTTQDVTNYQVIEREPLAVTYREATLLTNPAPSAGGRLVAHALEHLRGSPAATRPGDRNHLVPLARALTTIAPGSPGPVATQGTTHIAVADEEGNIASFTSTNGTGSGVMLADTGMHANNVMGEEDLHPAGFFTYPPGTRIGSMMAPSVLLRPGRGPVAFGSGGSERIRSALTQFVVALVDLDLPVADAVVLPRLHAERGVLHIEPGYDDDMVAQLEPEFDVNRWSARDLYFGGVHAVGPPSEHAGDQRRGGASAAL